MSLNAVTIENPQYKISLINNRRYLGNKYKLLPFITSVVNSECTGIQSVADIFAGTGAVSSAFTDKTITTNDLMLKAFDEGMLNMKKSLGEKLYVIKWLSDYQIEITNGYQIEAIRHSEQKWYNGEPQMITLRECSEEDFYKYPIEI